MRELPPVPPPPPGGSASEDDGFKLWKVFLTLGAMLLLVIPMFWLVVTLGDVLGSPVAAAVILLAVVVLVAFLFYRTGRREVTVGIATAYVALTVLPGGVCPGWREFIL